MFDCPKCGRRNPQNNPPCIYCGFNWITPINSEIAAPLLVICPSAVAFFVGLWSMQALKSAQSCLAAAFKWSPSDDRVQLICAITSGALAFMSARRALQTSWRPYVQIALTLAVIGIATSSMSLYSIQICATTANETAAESQARDQAKIQTKNNLRAAAHDEYQRYLQQITDTNKKRLIYGYAPLEPMSEDDFYAEYINKTAPAGNEDEPQSNGNEPSQSVPPGIVPPANDNSRYFGS